jgi:hypothetical protein
MDLMSLLAYVFRYKWADILKSDNPIIYKSKASYEFLL